MDSATPFHRVKEPPMFRDPGLPDWLEFVLGLLGYRW